VSVVSTLALAVKALTGRVTMYVPPDNPGAYNHELVQVMATYKLFRKFEALAAREIRRRLIEARRQAASHPENWKSLIGVEAIDTMVREAIDPLFAAAVEKGTDVGHAITNADVNTASAFPPDLKPPPYVKYGHGPFPKPPPASP